MDYKGRWSGEAIGTVTAKQPEYSYHILICIPKQGQGETKHDWYVWNQRIGTPSPVPLSKKYSGMSDNQYEYFYAEDTYSFGATTYFYRGKQDKTGTPPSGWEFSITVQQNADPVYQQNSKS